MRSRDGHPDRPEAYGAFYFGSNHDLGAKEAMKLLGNGPNDVDIGMGTAPKLRTVGGN